MSLLPLSHRFPPLLAAVVLLLAACAADIEPVVLGGVTMGTTWEVKLRAIPDGQTADTLQRLVSDTLAGVDTAMSTWRGDSELSVLNSDEGGGWIAVSPELFEVLAAARDVSDLTNGAFDVTAGPLVNLWGFGPGGEPDQVPDETAIQTARLRVGYDKLELDEESHRVRKHSPGLYIDLSGIAKGYAVDRVAAALVRAGAEDFVVEVGGEIKARGSNGRDLGWRVAIERPEGEKPERILILRNTGMATSGDYRNFFVKAGVQYTHIVDPATGRPVSHDAASVTVVTASAMRADALSTALLVLGPDEGLALANRERLAALFIMRTGDGFEERPSQEFIRLQ